jgi:hypothetical protein
MIVQRGTSILGERFIDIEVRGGSGFVEARLQGGVLEISYMEGRDVIFQIAQIQTELGREACDIIRGYATDELAEKIKVPGYLERFAGLMSARLGVNWSAQTVKEGAKTWLVFTKGS